MLRRVPASKRRFPHGSHAHVFVCLSTVAWCAMTLARRRRAIARGLSTLPPQDDDAEEEEAAEESDCGGSSFLVEDGYISEDEGIQMEADDDDAQSDGGPMRFAKPAPVLAAVFPEMASEDALRLPGRRCVGLQRSV
jgi:hypothetical protein